MKIVCDTNVLVSGMLFQGHPRTILQSVSKGLVEGFISIPILRELENVLQRPKFELSADQVAIIIDLVQQTFHTVSPTDAVDVVCADPDDNAIIEAALAARASRIVSGDRHLLDLCNIEGIQIVSPTQFMAELLGQDDDGNGGKVGRLRQ